jgi:hypothetical protein
VAACSAGVDDYRIVDDGIGGGSGGTSAAGGKLNADSGGRASGGQGGGGTGPDASAGGTTDSGGAGNAPSTGGGGIGAGGTNTGGGSNGGTSAGGTNAGGTSTGGVNTGGVNTGGVNTGGVNTGGVNTGGVNTGGVNTGGTNTGGVATGGAGGTTTFGKPVVVGMTMQLQGITAGAWDGQSFWVLNPTAKTFHRINPANTPATVTGPYSLPGTTLAPRVFGASTSHVFIIADTSAYRVPNAGSATGTAVPFGTTAELPVLRGAYAGGYLLVGKADGAASVARWFDGTTVGTATALTNVSRVATDGLSFAITRVNGAGTDIHRLAPGTWSLNPTPCVRGTFQAFDYPLSIFYTAVAWVLPGSGQSPRLSVSRITNGVCSSPSQVFFGVQGTTAHPVGLLAETHAVVVETFSGGAATLAVKDMVALETTAETSINLGGAVPKDLIVGGRYALVIGDNFPVLVSF